LEKIKERAKFVTGINFLTKKILEMAEMDTSGGGGHKKGPGVKKAKKASTRVDLTPMVDLGFLLITFFIFTTTISQPTTMRLNLPKDTDKPEEQNKLKESGALTLLLGKNDNVYYYEGQLDPTASNLQTSTMKKIRDEIIKKKRSTPAEDLMIVIKPGEESTYKDVVNSLDEMTINDIKRYALVDISEVEGQLLKKSDGQ
jgi:biopolymer transport protein ExbD